MESIYLFMSFLEILQKLFHWNFLSQKALTWKENSMIKNLQNLLQWNMIQLCLSYKTLSYCSRYYYWCYLSYYFKLECWRCVPIWSNDTFQVSVVCWLQVYVSPWTFWLCTYVQNPDISVPPNFCAKHGFATSWNLQIYLHGSTHLTAREYIRTISYSYTLYIVNMDLNNVFQVQYFFAK